MNDIDEDIAKKHDLRTTEGKRAARVEQHESDETSTFIGLLIFAAPFLGYVVYSIFSLLDGKDISVFIELMPYSDFSWWGWLLYGVGCLIGLWSLKTLFTEYLGRLIGLIIFIAIVIGVGYFVFG
tara:strand:- start:118 stop:492 length:375 start_codon:yes stop_codon:yes gene_type:complete